MDTEQQKALALAQAKRKRAEAGGASAGPKAKNGAFEGFGQAFWQGIDQPLEAMGDTAGVLGYDETAETLKGLTEQTPGYESATGHFMDGDNFTGLDFTYLPKAVAEQAGNFAGSLASRGAGIVIGGAVGGAVGSVAPGAGTAAGAGLGAAAGAIAGPAIFEAAQQFGPTALARAKANGRETPNTEDWIAAGATSAVAGALNAVAPGVSGIGKRAVVEGVTEGAQEVAQEVGTTLGTEQGLTISPKDIAANAILGAGSAGVVDGAIHGATATAKGAVDVATGDFRTDKGDFTADDAALAERLKTSVGDNENALGNVTSTTANEGAQSYAKAVLGDLRVETAELASGLKKLAGKNREAKIAVERAVKNTGNLKKSVTDENIAGIENHFPDTPDAKRLVSLLQQQKRLMPMTQANGDLGGLSQFTRRFDLLDGRNGQGLVGLGLGLAGAGTMGLGIGVNRAARLIDGISNRRSTIKRYVDSVAKSGAKTETINGETALEKLDALKASAERATKAQKMKDNLGRAAERKFEEERTADLKRIANADQKSIEALAKYNATPDGNKPTMAPNGQAQAQPDMRGKIDAQSRSKMWDTGEIPANDPYYEGYRRWKQATGMNPTDTLDTIEQLEREGQVPKGTARRYGEDIYSFKKDKTVPGIQRMVRDRANPDYQPNFNAEADVAVRKLDATSNKPGKSNGNYKKAEGQRRAANVTAQIEGSAASLSPQVHRALLDLKHAMDSQGVTRDQRFAMMDQTLSQLFPNQVERDMWTKAFSPLADIGNDHAIASKYDQETETKEEAFDKKVEQAKKGAKKKTKKSAEVKQPDQPELDHRPTETTADKALGKLKDRLNGPTFQETVDTHNEASQAQTAQEPEVAQPKANRTGLSARVLDRIQGIEDMLTLAKDRGQDFYDMLESLPKSTEGRVEKLIYESATDQLTANMLIDTFASRFDLPPAAAAEEVMKVLKGWEEAGNVKLVRQFDNNKLKVDGAYVQDEAGNDLHVLTIEPQDEGMKAALEVAKAINFSERLVDPEGPEAPYTPDRLKEGPHSAFKDIPPEQVDGTFAPILSFLNDLRSAEFAIHPKMLDQIESALMDAKGDKLGVIAQELNPVTGEYTTVNRKTGKASKKRTRDDGPWRTVGQMLHMFGDKAARAAAGTLFRQEWSAGRNLRVYAKNGLVTSHGGDIMKGLMRTDQKYKAGSKEAVDFMFHSFGNLLGFDKKSPKTRREAVLRPGVAEALIDFADNPFGQYVLKSSKGNEKPISKILDDGEGFFQVLNVAHEVKSMVEWAKARNPKLAQKDPGLILADPKVREDLAKNYETDFIVQLDASNNAYQISGLLMGLGKVLQATGIMPREGVTNPDETDAADIYVQPALNVVKRIPDLEAAGFPDSVIRKLFKKPIGTYLYAAEYNSRKKAFQDVLGDIAMEKGVNIIGIGGDGLIEMPQNIVEGLASENGAVFQRQKYDLKNETESTEAKVVRIVQKGDAFGIATRQADGSFKPSGKKFTSQADAMRYAYEQDLYTRMNRELVREFETTYPEVREYLNFFGKVTQMMKDRGTNSVKVPSPDGIGLEYSLKEVEDYTGHDTEFTNSEGNVVPLKIGIKSGESRFKGRGAAAFATHQIDAYVLRETYRRMKKEGIKSFNPIHDSFGFHPSDAKRGQETALQVMQELGSADYNLFLQILEANGIALKDFISAGGILPQRHDVQPQPARNIPTALS